MFRYQNQTRRVLFTGLSAIWIMILSISCFAERPDNPKLIKLPFSIHMAMENTPVLFNDRLLLVDNLRPGELEAKGENAYLFLIDLVTGQKGTPFSKGHSFACGFVNGDELNVFATEFTDFGNKMNLFGITRFTTTDLKNWTQQRVLSRQEGGDENLFNSSVCADDHGYIMAYEYNQPGTPNIWSFKFARSQDLTYWEKIEGIHYTDLQEKTFCACPCIRYFAPYYYVIYGALRNSQAGRQYQYTLDSTLYVSFLARSKDLKTWELSPSKYPMLDPVVGEGINNTDADLFEWDGNTYIYYATGNQADWASIRVAMYIGSMKEMFESYFPENGSSVKFDAVQGKYIYN
jgi:hypothetical protein